MRLTAQRTPLAEQDALSVALWLTRHASGSVAARFLDALEETIRDIEERPEVGRLYAVASPTLKGLRVLAIHQPFSKWLLFYLLDEDRLWVIRVLHGAQDLPKFFK